MFLSYSSFSAYIFATILILLSPVTSCTSGVSTLRKYNKVLLLLNKKIGNNFLHIALNTLLNFKIHNIFDFIPDIIMVFFRFYQFSVLVCRRLIRVVILFETLCVWLNFFMIEGCKIDYHLIFLQLIVISPFLYRVD